MKKSPTHRQPPFAEYYMPVPMMPPRMAIIPVAAAMPADVAETAKELVTLSEPYTPPKVNKNKTAGAGKKGTHRKCKKSEGKLVKVLASDKYTIYDAEVHGDVPTLMFTNKKRCYYRPIKVLASDKYIIYNEKVHGDDVPTVTITHGMWAKYKPVTVLEDDGVTRYNEEEHGNVPTKEVTVSTRYNRIKAKRKKDKTFAADALLSIAAAKSSDRTIY